MKHISISINCDGTGKSVVALHLLGRAVERLHLSARVARRLLRVARTIADLEGCETTSSAAVAEALLMRQVR